MMHEMGLAIPHHHHALPDLLLISTDIIHVGVVVLGNFIMERLLIT